MESVAESSPISSTSLLPEKNDFSKILYICDTIGANIDIQAIEEATTSKLVKATALYATDDDNAVADQETTYKSC